MHAYSQSAQTWITQFYLQSTPSLPFLRKRSPDGAAPSWGSRHRIAAYYSFIDPEGMKSWPGWLTYSGWLTWSPISYRSSTGRQKSAGKRPTFYRCATQPKYRDSLQGRSQKFILGGYNFVLHDTTVLYTNSLTTSAAISAQNNFQGLILGGYIYRYTPPSLRPWLSPTSCAKMAEQTEMQFGMLSRVGSGNMHYMGM